MLTGPASTQRKARTLRQQMSLPEVMLWQALRQRPHDLRFRRQHPAGPYILDFYCPRRRLAVEIDGQGHDQPAQWQHDRARDDWLRQHDVVTLRIPARDVLVDCADVVGRIAATALTLPVVGE
jgi:very-short-patch-repair endonuclease